MDELVIRCRACHQANTIQMIQDTRIVVGPDGEWECGPADMVEFCCTNDACPGVPTTNDRDIIEIALLSECASPPPGAAKLLGSETADELRAWMQAVIPILNVASACNNGQNGYRVMAAVGKIYYRDMDRGELQPFAEWITQAISALDQMQLTGFPWQGAAIAAGQELLSEVREAQARQANAHA
jgi:hypothetical protein